MYNTCSENIKTLRNIADELYRIQAGEELNEDGEVKSLYDYFEDALDIEYTVSSRREYLGAVIALTLGGPNIYLDTRHRELQLFWWGERETLPLDSSLCDEIDNIFEEFFDC